VLILGIDQSYKQTGVALIHGKPSKPTSAQILKVKTIKYKGLSSKTEKRQQLSGFILYCVEQYMPDLIICERIRQFSKEFISMPYITGTAALIASMVDIVHPIKIYSADTRSWKSRVCGSSKGGKDISTKYIYDVFGRKLNDDAADACCIALYGLIKGSDKLLKLED